MINFKELDFSILPKDNIQAPRVRRALYALLGAMIHTLICVLLWLVKDFHVSLSEFIKIFSAMWAMHIGFFFTIRTGINKRFEDPSLTAPMMIWAFTCIVYTMYLTYDLRNVLLMMNLLVLLFGVFQLNRSTFLFVTLYGIYLYFIMIVFFTDIPDPMTLREDWVIFLSYTIISLAFSMIASEINTLKFNLYDRNKKLAEALKYIESVSITDELTEVKNRRFILKTLENQKLMAERGKYTFSICMIDIDNFKSVNDTYGHLIGDNVLRRICKQTLKVIRKIDYFSRYGGEEFLLIFPFTNSEQGKQGAERIRKNIESTNFDDIAPNLKLTISLGMTQYYWPESIETVLSRVDEALYLAKNNGRNRVEMIELNGLQSPLPLDKGEQAI